MFENFRVDVVTSLSPHHDIANLVCHVATSYVLMSQHPLQLTLHCDIGSWWSWRGLYFWQKHLFGSYSRCTILPKWFIQPYTIKSNSNYTISCQTNHQTIPIKTNWNMSPTYSKSIYFITFIQMPNLPIPNHFKTCHSTLIHTFCNTPNPFPSPE